MTWKQLLTALVIGVVGFKAIWALGYPTSHHRFRLTVNVETPMGVRSGSNVMETVVTRMPGWNALSSGTHTYPTLDGEAILVDLTGPIDNKRRYLIATLMSDRTGTFDFGMIVQQAALDYLKANQDARNKQQSQTWPGQKNTGSVIGCGTNGDPFCEIALLPPGTIKDIRGNLIPTLVTLANPDDPESVSVVKPDRIRDTFGDGFRLRNVTLEYLTSGDWPWRLFGLGVEPITRTIETRLPKLFEMLRVKKYPSSTGIGDPFLLHRSHLQRSVS